MATHKHKNGGLPRVLFCVIAIAVSITAITVLYSRFTLQRNNAPDDRTFVEKLKSAKHVQSKVPPQRYTVDLVKKWELRHAASNAFALELREVGGMATGAPESVFAMLSHLGGFGEIIWIDQWTNFPVKLPPTRSPPQVVVPRRDAVRGALDAIEASGGCLVKAGEKRYLVAKISEKKKCEAAIRALGWLDGSPPPWVK